MFLSILLQLSRNLAPSLRTTSYVQESRRWQSFSLFGLSELVCNKNVIHPILLFPLLSYPKLLPLWSVTDRRTTFVTPCSLSSFFSLSARAPPAGATQLGWPNYGVDGRLNKLNVKCGILPEKNNSISVKIEMCVDSTYFPSKLQDNIVPYTLLVKYGTYRKPRGISTS